MAKQATTSSKTPAQTAPAAAGAPLFALTGKAPRGHNTPQLGGTKSGLGNQWVKAAKPAPNSRALALAALATLGATFTMEAGLKALSALPKGSLGSGSPRSYWAAFVASGYVAAKQ